MRLTLRTPDEEGYIRVSCTGQLSQPLFTSHDPLVHLLGADCYGKKVVLDLDRVDYIDTSGVSFLVGSHNRFRAGGGVLALTMVPPTVQQVLKFTKLDTFLNIRA